MNGATNTVTLDNLCDLVNVQVAPEMHEHVAYIGLEHVAPGNFFRIGQGTAFDVQSSKFAFKRGDVLYGKLRPYLDKAVLADIDGICTTELLVLRPKRGVDPHFLLSVVHAPNFIDHAISGVTGVQHPRTSWHRIKEFELPDFGDTEQNNIANLLFLIQKTMCACGHLIEAANDLKRATLLELFTRGLRGEVQKETEIGLVPESWELLPIKSFGEIVTGTTPPTKDRTFYDDGNIFFIAPGDFDSGTHISRTEKQITHRGLSVSRPLPKGTTCFVCIGSTIGKVGYVVSDICASNQQINSIIPNKTFIDKYVFYLMTFYSDYIRQQASPSPVPILSKGAFEKIEIYTSTDSNEQNEIAKILDAIDHKIDLHKRKRLVLEELFKSLLHKLMIGEICVKDLDLSPLETVKTGITA